MKNFIALALICLLNNTWAVSLEDEFTAAENDCLKEKQLSREEVFERQDLSNPTASLKIFAGCFLEKVGFIKAGILQEDIIVQKAKTFEHPTFFKHCVRMCRHIKGTDPNDIAYKLGLCFRKVDKVYFQNEWKYVCDSCQEEKQLSNEEYTKLQKLPIDNPTEAMKHYVMCVFERQGFLKDNVLQEDDILEISEDYKDAEYLKTFVNRCKHIKDDNEYIRALKLFECMQKIKETHI